MWSTYFSGCWGGPGPRELRLLALLEVRRAFGLSQERAERPGAGMGPEEINRIHTPFVGYHFSTKKILRTMTVADNP